MKKLAAFFIGIICSLALQAQDDGTAPPRPGRAPREPWYDRLVYGGNLGLQFGNYTLVDISPIVGYKVTDRLVPAVGITYQYINIRFSNNQRYINTIYGYSGILRYYIMDNLFAHGEVTQLNGQWLPWQQSERYWITGVLVGGGYRQNFGGNFGASITALWNLNPTPEWPYRNPIIRAGIGVGF